MKWSTIFSPSSGNIDSRRPSHTSSIESSSTDASASSKKQPLLSIFQQRSRGSSCSSFDLEKETEKLQLLYDLALDEIKYAEDSRGSPYYAGDRITAREAIDGYHGAYSQLMTHSADNPSLRSELEITVAPRLTELQTKYEALPSLED
ncbi:hypothetical protein BCR43DRAFT_493106 [Syncephalastrum racemosum]|uniref:Uncharacterized protein n=1 Tax=Syncephalastrum racemosum TaxID=13706 RepID=A0A1X2HA29_SYNRA|nr:hypothetical protein BCR43DRAFT_493106 [Syncephalastrum racemosum]